MRQAKKLLGAAGPWWQDRLLVACSWSSVIASGRARGPAREGAVGIRLWRRWRQSGCDLAARMKAACDGQDHIPRALP